MKITAFLALIFLAVLAWAQTQSSGITAIVGSVFNYTLGSVVLPNSTIPTLPCVAGEVYVDTNATSGLRVVLCESGAWVPVGSGVTGSGTTTEEVYMPVAVVTFGDGLQFSNGFTSPDTISNGAGLLSAGTAPWQSGFATFPVNATSIIHLIGHMRLHSGWTGGAVSIDLTWFPASGGVSGNIAKVGIEGVCDGAGMTTFGSAGPTFNAVVLADATLGATPDGKTIITTIVPNTTGCSAGEKLLFRIRRNSTTGNGDTLGVGLNLVSATVRYTRNL